MTSQHSEPESVDNKIKYDKLVYNNAILAVQKNVSNEKALAKSAKHRSESLKCSNCAWSSIKARKRPNVFYTMKRFYIKERNSWKTIGWYCPNCGSIIIDELVKPFFSFASTPEPKITALKIRQK